MLPCQHLRRCHNRRLIAVLYRPESRRQRDSRFAAAYVPLYQPIHDLSGCHILLDFFQHSFLCICQRKGQYCRLFPYRFFPLQADSFAAVLQRLFQPE